MIPNLWRWIDLEEKCSMMGLWKLGKAHIARTLMHTERVWLRSLQRAQLPQPQLTPSVCISRLRNYLCGHSSLIWPLSSLMRPLEHDPRYA